MLHFKTPKSEKKLKSVKSLMSTPPTARRVVNFLLKGKLTLNLDVIISTTAVELGHRTGT